MLLYVMQILREVWKPERNGLSVETSCSGKTVLGGEGVYLDHWSRSGPDSILQISFHSFPRVAAAGIPTWCYVMYERASGREKEAKAPPLNEVAVKLEELAIFFFFHPTF